MIKEYLSKVKNMSPAAKASFWFVISNIALKGISFITTPIFTRMLDVADYGTTSVFVTWEGVISIFATLSLYGGVYNVAMTKFEKDVDKYTSSMLGLSAVSSVIVYTICIGINLVFPSLFKINTFFLIFMWLQTYTNSCSTFWLMRKRYNYEYKPVIAYTFANSLLSPIIAIIAIKLVPMNKAYAKIIGAGIIGIVIGTVFFALALKKSKKLYHKNYWIYALKFNIPLLPHYLSSTLLNSTDKLMIDNMIGKAEAGIYSVSHSITGVIGIVTQSINMSLIPYTLQSIKKCDFKGLKKTILGCSVLVSVICVMISFFAREGILIFATKKYLDAVAFVFPLSLAVELSFISGLVGNIVFYYEQTKFMSATTIICAVVNIVLNYFGIKKFGYIAAGYTTMISDFLRLILYYACAKRYEKNLSEIISLKGIFLIIGVSAFVMFMGLVLVDYLIIRIAFMVCVALVLFLLRKKIIELFANMKTNKEEA